MMKIRNITLIALVVSTLAFSLSATACEKQELEARFHVGYHDAMATLSRFVVYVTGVDDSAHTLSSLLTIINREEQNTGNLLKTTYAHIPYVHRYNHGQGTDEK